MLSFVDVDHFKAVNEPVWTDHGDEPLKLIADQIESQVRDLILLHGLEERSSAFSCLEQIQVATNTVAERIRSGVQSHQMGPIGEHYPLSLSNGGVTSSGKVRPHTLKSIVAQNGVSTPLRTWDAIMSSLTRYHTAILGVSKGNKPRA